VAVVDRAATACVVGAEARELGWGGVAAVAEVAGVARSTVSLGVAELDSPSPVEAGRSRRSAGDASLRWWLIRGWPRR